MAIRSAKYLDVHWFDHILHHGILMCGFKGSLLSIFPFTKCSKNSGDNYKCNVIDGNWLLLMIVSLESVPLGMIDERSSLVYISNRSLFKPMMLSYAKHLCHTRGGWVKKCLNHIPTTVSESLFWSTVSWGLIIENQCMAITAMISCDYMVTTLLFSFIWRKRHLFAELFSLFLIINGNKSQPLWCWH